MHQHPPLAGRRRRRRSGGKGHPGGRSATGGEGGDAARIEGVAQARDGRRTPAPRQHADGGQAGHQEKEHQGQGEGGHHHPGAASQQHAPAQAGPHLQGQQTRQSHHHRTPLQEARRQIRLHGALHPGAEQLEEAHQAPLLHPPRLPELEAREQGEHHRQAAEHIHGPQGQQAGHQQTKRQPLQKRCGQSAAHGPSASRSRQRSRWASPSPGPTTTPCQSRP